MTDPFETPRNNAAGMPGHPMSADVGVREASGDRLRARLKQAGWTSLQADYLPEGDHGQDEGWRIHDHPTEPNPQGVYFAHFICGGLAEAEAKAICLAVNAALNAPTESVKAPEGVTQEDREAAADVAEWMELAAIGGNDVAAIRNGVWDTSGDLSFIVQAFARHRLAASPTPITADDAVAKERERCARICEEQERVFASSEYTTDPLASFGERFACRQIAAAIRSLSPDTEGEGM